MSLAGRRLRHRVDGLGMGSVRNRRRSSVNTFLARVHTVLRRPAINTNILTESGKYVSQ
jgi:hypothetical protein